MALIVAASALLHTERHDGEAKANYRAGRTGTPWTILRTDVHREVHSEQLRAKTIGVAAKTIS